MAKIEDEAKKTQGTEWRPTKDEVLAFERLLEDFKKKRTPDDLTQYGDPITDRPALEGYVYNGVFKICHWAVVQHALDIGMVKCDRGYWIITAPARYCRFEILGNELRKLKSKREFAREQAGKALEMTQGGLV